MTASRLRPWLGLLALVLISSASAQEKDAASPDEWPYRLPGGRQVDYVFHQIASTDASRRQSGRLTQAIVRIENSEEGTLFLGEDESTPWKHGKDGWHVVRLAPPYEVDPRSDAPQLEHGVRDWASVHVMVGRDGAIYTVSAVELSPGTRATTRREEGKTVRLGLETSDLDAEKAFVTPDGSLWCIDEWLRRFQGGRWRRVGRRPPFREPSTPYAIESPGPPWLLKSSGLWRLDPNTPDAQARYREIRLMDAGREIGLSAWVRDRELMFSSGGHLRNFDPVSGRLTRASGPQPPEQPMSLEPIRLGEVRARGQISSLARDRLGRIWAGGEGGLYLRPAAGASWEAFDSIAALGPHAVTALAADPARVDGVIASFGERGVAFVRAAADQ